MVGLAAGGCTGGLQCELAGPAQQALCCSRQATHANAHRLDAAGLEFYHSTSPMLAEWLKTGEGAEGGMFELRPLRVLCGCTGTRAAVQHIYISSSACFPTCRRGRHWCDRAAAAPAGACVQEWCCALRWAHGLAQQHVRLHQHGWHTICYAMAGPAPLMPLLVPIPSLLVGGPRVPAAAPAGDQRPAAPPGNGSSRSQVHMLPHSARKSCM